MTTLNIGLCNYQWLIVFIQVSFWPDLFIRTVKFKISLALYGYTPPTSTHFFRWEIFLLCSIGWVFHRALAKDDLVTPYSWKINGWVPFKRILTMNADCSYHSVYDLFPILKRIWAHAHRKIWCWLLFSNSFFWLLEILYCWVGSKWVTSYLISRYWGKYLLGAARMHNSSCTTDMNTE